MISIIIPTFNRSKRLLKAVESVLCQTYRDFELIVIDDGSTENLQHISELVQDNGHKFIRTDNQGVAQARNFGVSQSRGEWISFLDSDDCWRPKKLEQQVKFHSENPNLLISQCEETWIRKGKKVNKKKYQVAPDGEAFESSVKLCCISPSCVMMHRQLFKEKGGFDRRFVVCEDYDLWLRITVDNEVGLVKELEVEKYGGHEDQLSMSEPAMDRYRVFALLKLVMNFDLDKKKLKSALTETHRKANILFKGAVKHQVPFANVFKTAGIAAKEAIDRSLNINSTRNLVAPVFSEYSKVALSTYPTKRR